MPPAAPGARGSARRFATSSAATTAAAGSRRRTTRYRSRNASLSGGRAMRRGRASRAGGACAKSLSRRAGVRKGRLSPGVADYDEPGGGICRTSTRRGDRVRSAASSRSPSRYRWAWLSSPSNCLRRPSRQASLRISTSVRPRAPRISLSEQPTTIISCGPRSLRACEHSTLSACLCSRKLSVGEWQLGQSAHHWRPRRVTPVSRCANSAAFIEAGRRRTPARA